MHEIFIESSAERYLKKISKDKFNKIIIHIKRLAKNPRPAGSRKLTGERNFWRIRIGDYRVIYEVNSSKKTVKIYKVKHRRDVYR